MEVRQGPSAAAWLVRLRAPGRMLYSCLCMLLCDHPCKLVRLPISHEASFEAYAQEDMHTKRRILALTDDEVYCIAAVDGVCCDLQSNLG